MRKREVAIRLENINKSYNIEKYSDRTIKSIIKKTFNRKYKPKTLQALKNINLTIYKGETFGIIGRNGSGKSTLLNIMIGSIPPDKGGIIKTNGSIIRLSLGMGIDPNLTARDNIYVNGTVLGLSFKKIGTIFHEIIRFAELKDFVDIPVKLYSKGMKQRLMFSIAIHVNADIILLDEFFGGTGDQVFRKKSNRIFKEKLLKDKTIIFVSHSVPRIESNCKRSIWLNKGKIKSRGPTAKVLKEYSEFNETTAKR